MATVKSVASPDTFQPFTKLQNFGLIQIGISCRQQFNVAKLTTKAFDRIENMVEKGENADYQHFLLFPQSFQKAFQSGPLKVRILW